MWLKNKNRSLLAFLLVALAVGGFLCAPKAAHAAAGVNQLISFEGKIVKSDGTNITDGTYNVEFKIYSGPSSTGSGDSLLFTEDWLVGSTQGGIKFTSSTFAANIGGAGSGDSVPLSSLNFNQYPLWLSFQIGNNSSCTISTSFQSNCGGDGEMTPYVQFTSAPYALNAGAVGGLTASQLVQLSPSAQQTGSVNVSGNITTAGTLQGNALTAASGTTLALGSNASSTNILTIDSGTGSSAIQIGNSATAHGIQIGTGAATQTIVIGSTNTSSALTLQGGTSNLAITNSGVAVTGGLTTTNTAGVAFTATGDSASDDIADFKVNGGTIAADFNSAGQFVSVHNLQTTVTGTSGILSAYKANATDTNTAASTSVANGFGTNLYASAANSNLGYNVLNGLDVFSVTPVSGNTFNGVTVGTGFNTILNYASSGSTNVTLIDGTGNFFTPNLDATSGTSSLNIGNNNAATINLGNVTASASTLNLGTGTAAAQTVKLGSGFAGSATTVQAGTSSLALLSSGAALSGGSAGLSIATTTADNTSTALSVENLNSTTLLTLAGDGTGSFGIGYGSNYLGLGLSSGVDSNDQNLMSGDKFTTGAAGGTVTTANVYIPNSIDPTRAKDKFQMAVYSDSSGSPGTLLASSTSGTLTANSWNAIPLSLTLSSSTSYWIFYNTNASAGTYNQPGDSTGCVNAVYKTQTYGTYPASFGTPGGANTCLALNITGVANGSGIYSVAANHTAVITDANTSTGSAATLKVGNNDINLAASSASVLDVNTTQLNYSYLGATILGLNNFSSSLNTDLTLTGSSTDTYSNPSALKVQQAAALNESTLELMNSSGNVQFNETSAGTTALNALAPATISSTTTATTGGSLPATTTYYYQVMAVDGSGNQSDPLSYGTPESSVTTGSGTTNTVRLVWAPVTGAVAYDVYWGTSSGGENAYFATAPYNVTALTQTSITSATLFGSTTTTSVAAALPTTNAAYITSLGAALSSFDTAVNIQGNAGTQTTSTSGATGGSGGGTTVLGGVGGFASGATGANVGGLGGSLSFTGGTGGNVTSATGTAGSGGAVTIQGGAAGTGGATAGAIGAVAIQTVGGNTTIGNAVTGTTTNLLAGSAGVKVGTTAASSSPTLLTLSSKNTTGDPTEVDGAMYYNSFTGSFRCGQAGAWTNCIGGLMSSNVAASTALTGATTGAQNFTTTSSIPANYCVSGRVINLTANGILSTAATAQPISFAVKLGTTQIGSASVALTPAASLTGRGWTMEYHIICDAAPSAASAVTGQGWSSLPGTTATAADQASDLPFLATNAATNAAQTINISATFTGTANATNTMTLEQLIVSGE
jgi:hypothetical protein